VHSAKFLSEKDPENIRHALDRHNVAHPVVVDSDHEIWQQFAVRAWPTLVLVDAAGYVRETISGEIEEDELAHLIERLLDEGAQKGILKQEPLDVSPDPELDRTFLRFPGKIHVRGERLFLSDTGHNRIVIAGTAGNLIGIVGEGGVGAHDGPAGEASFHAPHGLALIDETLYVADTGNHMIRAIDLATSQVTTVAGTGAKGRSTRAMDPHRPLEVPLRSPWGLLRVGAQLLIAMAGTHQIWAYDPVGSLIAPWAGTGREDHIDGKLDEAAFAQPSGLARIGRHVVIADSEISSIRVIDLDSGRVQTIVGRGLFDFGDRDGAPADVLLQHPMDVAADANRIYVADTYNNKIKGIRLGDMSTETLFGDGRPETMHEPGGIAAADGRVWIADTNNHRVLCGNPDDGSLSPVEFR
jgi:DNA-binding beta-propeller fold protein YncE